MAIGPRVEQHFQGYLNTMLTIIMMVCVLIILANALWRWITVLSRRARVLRADVRL
jgi:hypothetical protein